MEPKLKRELFWLIIFAIFVANAIASTFSLIGNLLLIWWLK